MANSRQAAKRARQADKRRAHNASMRSAVRTAVKQVLASIESGDKTAAQAAYLAAVPKLDKLANKGMIKKNKAARHKSRLNAHIRAM